MPAIPLALQQIIDAHRANRKKFALPAPDQDTLTGDVPPLRAPSFGAGFSGGQEADVPMDAPNTVRARKPVVGDPNAIERVDPAAMPKFRGAPRAPAQQPEKPWHFVPRLARWTGEQTQYVPTLADKIVGRGHLGFGDQIQDAMDRMLQVNLSNQQAVGRNRETAAQVEIARLQAQAALEAQRIKANALAAALGLGGDSGGGSKDKPRYTSNIGQSINWSGSW